MSPEEERTKIGRRDYDDGSNGSDWERWRGGVDATQKALVDRLESGLLDVASHINTLHVEMTQGFTDIKARQDYTNGHVRELREWKASVQGEAIGERKVEVRVQNAETSRRFKISQLLVACLGAATVSASLAAGAMTLLH